MSSQKYERIAIVTVQDNTSAALTAISRAFCATISTVVNDTELNFWGDFELLVTFSVAPTAGKVLQAWAIPTLDGTNYMDGNETVAPDTGLRLGGVAVRAVTTAQRLAIPRCVLPPHSFKLLLDNGADQTISAGWQIKLIKYRTQSV